ncbi:hypothetical protein [Streptomyces sp. NPDC051561]|uniref:hypothetical protein n=1 Tax=Streptomyces sp. NPDC051561 TaxID=3365658 RepID=UPI00378EE3F2
MTRDGDTLPEFNPAQDSGGNGGGTPRDPDGTDQELATRMGCGALVLLVPVLVIDTFLLLLVAAHSGLGGRTVPGGLLMLTAVVLLAAALRLPARLSHRDARWMLLLGSLMAAVSAFTVMGT